MRILITGGKGFVANHLANKLKKSHEVQTVDREDFDHSNREEVEKWFENRYYDDIFSFTILHPSQAFLSTSQVIQRA